MPAVLHPDAVVVIRHGVQPVVLHNVDAISVVGGEPLPPDVRYSAGWRSPEAIGLVLRGGERQRFDDVQVVAIKGGVGEAELRNKVPIVGGGGTTRQMIVDDGGIGLGQIENVQQDSEYIDEIDQYLIDKEKATRAAGGDEFRGRIGMKRSEIAALNAQAPFVRNVPASALNCVLGNTTTVTPPGVPATGGEAVYSEAAQVALWDGEDVESTAVTVLFGPTGEPNTTTYKITAAQGSIALRPIGVVQFGTRGYLMTAEVDIARGCQFTVCASYVRLSVKVSGEPVIGSANIAASATGMIAFHTSVRTAPLTCTRYWNGLAAGLGTSHMRIPAFAQTLIIYRFRSTIPFAVIVRDLGGVQLFNFAIAAEVLMDTISLPGNAYFIEINNLSNVAGSGGVTDFNLIYGLGL